VHPDFPAEAPGAQRRIFPIVLDEAHVVLLQVEAERRERTQVEIEDLGWRGLEHDLELVVLVQAIRILAVAPVFRPARRLYVRRAPGLGPEGAQKRSGVRRP